MLSRLETLETIHGDGACCHVHQETGDSHERWSSGFLLVTMCIQSASFKHSQNFVAKATTTQLVRHLPYVARMGTAISVMLLSERMQGMQRAVPSTTTKALSDATPDAEPMLLMDQRPQDGLEPTTDTYPAAGFFTGIRSSVVVPQPPSRVYDSLASDLHLMFGSIEECNDKLQTDDGEGRQVLHRYVKIPFSLSYYHSALKMKLEVENDKRSGQIFFKSLSQGRFLSAFVASFTIRPIYDRSGVENSLVEMDSRIVVNKLPPPPLKGLVKGVVVRKMDRCMRDLAEFHSRVPYNSDTAPHLANNIQPGAGLQRKLSTKKREQRRSLL